MSESDTTKKCVKVIVLNVDRIAMRTLLERLKIGGRMKSRHREPRVMNYHGYETYRLLKCCGCDTVYIQREEWFSEMDDPVF